MNRVACLLGLAVLVVGVLFNLAGSVHARGNHGCSNCAVAGPSATPPQAPALASARWRAWALVTGSLTATMTSIPAFNRTTTISVVWEDDATKAHSIYTSPQTVITSDARRVFNRHE